MKKIITAAAISLFAIGSASADVENLERYDLLHGGSQAVDVNSLPPTAAGVKVNNQEQNDRSNHITFAPEHG